MMEEREEVPEVVYIDRKDIVRSTEPGPEALPKVVADSSEYDPTSLAALLWARHLSFEAAWTFESVSREWPRTKVHAQTARQKAKKKEKNRRKRRMK